jgi:hypothetical protein
MASWFAASTSGGKTFAGYYGPWANGGKGAKNRYLGLKFMIKGKVHFGWARVTVKFIGHHAVSGTLTGYAYETIPNKAIITGKKIESDEIDNSAEQPNPGSLSLPTSEPGTLGLLAMGGPGLSIWRREPLGAQP